MKLPVLLLFVSVLCLSQLYAQDTPAFEALSTTTLSKSLDSLANASKLTRNKNVNHQGPLVLTTAAPCHSVIDQLEAEIANQQITIQSQEMMIEQIMKRLEILEKGHQEKPLSIVLHSIIRNH